VKLLERASQERWLLAGGALALALVVLAWNQWVRDDDDEHWTKGPWTDNSQPPAQLGAPLPTKPPCGPLVGCGGRPMDPGEAMRTRSYPDSLTSSHSSFIGEF
jgi:hypothetical protein